MALKKKIDKATFDALPDAIKSEYNRDGENYVLNVEGGLEGDAPELKRARDREKQRADDAEAALKAANDKLNDPDVDARKKGDIAVLEKSWNKKLEDQRTEAAAKETKYQSFAKKHLIDAQAQSIASRISKNPELIIPHIKARLTADFEGDEPSTRVLDKNGKPTALTLAELESEFVANPVFADIIVATKASGSGASGGGGSGTGGGAPGKKLSEMNEAERVKFARENPSEFKRIVAEQGPSISPTVKK